MAKTTGCVPETLHRKTTEANLWCRAPDHVGKSILRYAVVAAGVDIGGRPQRVSRANSKTTVCPLRRAKNDTSSAWLQLPSNEVICEIPATSTRVILTAASNSHTAPRLFLETFDKLIFT